MMEDLENYEAVLKTITSEDIRQAFCKIVNLDDQVILSIGDFMPCEN